jgi:N-acyl-D-aspartate/D-glutamate deacylase
VDGGQDPRRDRQDAGKGIIDCLCDLTIEENLDTEWLHGENNVDDAAVAQILNYPNAIIGLSDGGAHVQFQSGFGFSTRLLSRMGAREADHVAGAGGAPADLRIGLDLRPL